ncbi:S-adenosyl-L-methionine-dependent methyltransferase [Hysterangium stoloniferum]|nr:S-adenosyl-L-methionine-dependent methyltransferase [Hysterangium stoloniferum]
MSTIHVRGAAAPANSESDSQSSSSGDAEETWDDWVSESGSTPCKSLFDDQVFPSAEAALQNDRSKHDFDLDATCSKLGLDFHGRVRLINYIRRQKPSAELISSFTGSEAFFSDDGYLQPAIPDDPLLQLTSDDWSDSEDEDAAVVQPMSVSEPKKALQRIRRLEEKLAAARQELIDYRKIVEGRFDLNRLAKDISSDPNSEEPKVAPRDDDSHYFRSYAENDIHAVMIQDAVRTSSYASFILSNPALFRGATVLDVGCGTGILSLFAAQAGAKRVFAVDASDIAEKAESIARANNMENVITVIRGKIEDIALPDGVTQVDVIISEWMGYALLYESMLDSVLVARDRFLKPGGVMVPSQCKMMFGLSDAKEIFKERIGFWSDVYGFDLSAMAADIYDDSIVDIVGEDTLVTNTVPVKLQSLNFTSSFKLTATKRALKAHAFILYFDTFFTPTGASVPEDATVNLVKKDEPSLAEVWQVPGKVKRKDSAGSKGKEVSFSTGPLSVPTHWKHTLFLLKEPIKVEEGSTILGTFHCRKSEDNSRELDVEIHYSVLDEGQAVAQDTIIQMYHVR